MSTKHTAEPWHKIGGMIIPAIDVTGDSPVIAECGLAENAARIVQCVNACAGMEDPAKEIAELKELAWRYKELCK